MKRARCPFHSRLPVIPRCRKVETAKMPVLRIRARFSFYGYGQDAHATDTGKMPVPRIRARCPCHRYGQDAHATDTGKMPMPRIRARCPCHGLLGRTTGLEPASGGTTIHCLNHLATLAIILPLLIIASYLLVYQQSLKF